MQERVKLPVSGLVVQVRELTGADERAVDSASTASAVELLSRITTANVAGLCASDRDRLLASAYRLTLGDRLDTSATCSACHSLFDINFRLSLLLESLETGGSSEGLQRRGDGSFLTGRGSVFRLPTAEEELAAGSAAELRRRCVEVETEGDDIEAAMRAAAPLVAVDLNAACPECGQEQAFHFDLQTYLLETLVRERRRLLSELQMLAVSCGWSLTELLTLRRGERRALVDMVDRGQRAPRVVS
jgi:hypothetical protein